MSRNKGIKYVGQPNLWSYIPSFKLIFSRKQTGLVDATLIYISLVDGWRGINSEILTHTEFANCISTI